MPSGDGFDRIATIILSQTLEIEDLIFEHTSHVGPAQRRPFTKSLDHMLHGVLDYVLQRFVGRSTTGLLPDGKSDDDEEYPDKEGHKRDYGSR